MPRANAETSIQLNPHEILGVSPGSSQQELDAAFENAEAKYARFVGCDTWVRQAVRDAHHRLSASSTTTQARGIPEEQEAVGPISLSGNLPLQNETTYFILVNVLDIFMTYLLLNLGAVEANPIAAFFIDRWGFAGMIIFKLAIVAAVCVVSQVVATRNMRYARGLLWAGIIIVGGVVIYSLRLLTGQMA